MTELMKERVAVADLHRVLIEALRAVCQLCGLTVDGCESAWTPHLVEGGV